MHWNFLLLFILSAVEFIRSEDIGCVNRIDILDGSTLVEELSVFLSETKRANSQMQCALLCFSQKCDVAYFHSSRKECQFSPDSATNDQSLNCPFFEAVLLPTMQGENNEDNVFRFCVKCRGSTATKVNLPREKMVISSMKKSSQTPRQQSFFEKKFTNRPVHIASTVEQRATVGQQINRERMREHGEMRERSLPQPFQRVRHPIHHSNIQHTFKSTPPQLPSAVPIPYRPFQMERWKSTEQLPPPVIYQKRPLFPPPLRPIRVLRPEFVHNRHYPNMNIQQGNFRQIQRKPCQRNNHFFYHRPSCWARGLKTEKRKKSGIARK